MKCQSLNTGLVLIEARFSLCERETPTAKFGTSISLQCCLCCGTYRFFTKILHVRRKKFPRSCHDIRFKPSVGVTKCHAAILAESTFMWLFVLGSSKRFSLIVGELEKIGFQAERTRKNSEKYVGVAIRFYGVSHLL